MNLQDIREIYEYNQWANKLILDTAEKVTPEQFVAPSFHSFSTLHATLVHTLDTEWSWRILLQTGEFTEDMKPEDFPTLEAVRARWMQEEADWKAYLDSLTDADLTGILRYTIPEGIVRERLVWHCLYHVVNHGMQHRSECASLLTLYGHSPGNLDFTRFLNERVTK